MRSILDNVVCRRREEDEVELSRVSLPYVFQPSKNQGDVKPDVKPNVEVKEEVHASTPKVCFFEQSLAWSGLDGVVASWSLIFTSVFAVCVFFVKLEQDYRQR